jgi:hypothetical protein
MKVNCLIEGGAGDFLCANRFVPSIIAQNNCGRVNLFANTDGNPKSAELLIKLWPSLYNPNFFLVERKSPNFKISSQFGEEIYPAHFDNIVIADQNILKDCDKLYNLHIDGLEWLSADFNYNHSYYHFPRPEIQEPAYSLPFQDNFVMAHLAARKGGAHELEEWYLNRFLNDFIRKTEHNLVIVTTDECAPLYNEFKDNPRIFICNPTMLEMFDIAKRSKMFIGIDSGIRYIPLHYGKPSFVLTKYCQAPGQASHSHLIRWLIFGKYCLPLNYNSGEVIKIINNIYKHPAYMLFPNFPSENNIENIIVQRNFNGTA